MLNSYVYFFDYDCVIKDVHISFIAQKISYRTLVHLFKKLSYYLVIYQVPVVVQK